MSTEVVECGGGQQQQQQLMVYPVTRLPAVIELSYYANGLFPVLALEAVVATSVLSLVTQVDLWAFRDAPTVDASVEKEQVVKRSLRLAKLLENEFILASPCSELETKVLSVLDDLVTLGLLTAASAASSQAYCGLDDDEDRVVTYRRQFYQVL